MAGRRFAYADPPYLGCARRYCGTRHPEAAVYDTIDAHAELVRRLVAEFPDGWALSLHSPSLKAILQICPDDVRVGSWVKPFSGTRPGIRGRFAWEPVIYRAPVTWEHGPQFVDWMMANAPRATGSDELFPGRKPEAFCAWVCDLLGVRAGDEVVDLFPGSGACTRAFAKLRALDPEQFELQGLGLSL